MLKEEDMNPIFCFIKKSYFQDNHAFVKVLDIGNADKQSKRTHLCVKIEQDGNKFYIPLRNNLGAEIRKFGRIGHSVPSKKGKMRKRKRNQFFFEDLISKNKSHNFNSQ